MGAGEGTPPARREISARRRRWLDGDCDDDEEYVLEEEEEEEEDCAEELSASSADEEGEGSDAEYQQDEEEEEEEIETPRPKRPAKGSDRGRKGKVDPAAARSRRRKYEEDDDYEEEDEEEEEVEYRDELEEVEEEEEAPPRPKSLVKCGGRSQNVKPATAAKRSRQQRHLDDDYKEEEEEEEDVEEEEEVEEYRDEPDEEEVEYCDELEEEEEVEEYRDELEEEEVEYRDELEEVEEEEPPRPKGLAKCGGRSRNVKPATAAKRSHQRRHLDDDDMDFDPELDDEDELDEDIDFDPEADDDDEDEYQDEEEEELSAIRARKVTVKNPAKRKSVSKRRTLKKKKKKSKGSKASGKKSASAKAKKSAPVRRRKKRSVIDEYEDDDDDDEDDDDFIVEDERPRKKARTRNGREDPEVSPVEEETWPNLESDTSEFEFATSDEEHNDAETPVVEQITVKKGRKKRTSGSESSSDSEFVVSDKELEDLRETELPKPMPMLPASVRRLCITRNGEGKGKEKQEQEESGKPICGICLSEEQRATVQGVLNCCSHYFCFACIMEWSRVESRCPLCKQRFTTITKSSKVDLGLGVRKAVIKVEERDQVYQPTEEEIRRWLDPYENVVCIECNQGGDDSLMLLCDICDSSAHTYCVGLGREVPEGNWYCGGCRLGDEGPSYTGIQRTVAYERQNYRIVDNSFGSAAPSGTLERPPSINTRRSFQGIDLNLSPREFPGETHTAESQVSTDSVSTPTGRRATLSGRRQIHRYIRILLTRPRPPSRQDAYHNIAQHSGGVPRAEPSRRNLPTSSETNTSHSLPDGIQNHHSDLPFVQAHNNFAPCTPLDGDEGVKSNLRNL